MKHATLSWLPAAALAMLLPLRPLPARAQAPDLHSPAAYLPADQARFQAPAPAAARPAPAAGTHRLPAGVAVLGWVPYWVPAGYLRSVDFSLLSHVAYDGYQATEVGALQAPPTGDAGPLAALVHQANPRCRVLLGVRYHEPAGGAALFGAAGGPARQALAQAVARQAGALQADGLYLDLGFRARAAAPAGAAARAGSKSELASTDKRLDKTLDNLNYRNRLLTQSGESLQHTRDNFARRRQQGKTISANELSQYARAQQQHQADSAQFITERTRYRAERAALKQKQVLPDADDAPADNRPAAVRELVAALRQALPQATLALGLPALDSSRVYDGLLTASPLADLYVLQALDCTAARPGEPGPLAPWQPSAAGGPQAVATAVSYYRQQGVPAAQLLLGLASLGKVWTRHNPANEMPPEGAPIRYWYATSRTLAGWPPRLAQPDSAAGANRLTLPPPPDSLQAGLLAAPYFTWADDTTSLGARLAWVRRQGLGGVGIWALGFDAPDAPLWRSLLAHLAEAPAAAPPATTSDSTAQLAPAAAAAPDTTQAGGNSLLPPGLADDARLAVGPQVLAVGLLALAVLLAGAWVGLLAGAANAARYWLPFGRRRSWMLAALLAGAALLGGYVSSLGVFSHEALIVGWLGALALLLLGWLTYRQGRPATPLP